MVVVQTLEGLRHTSRTQKMSVVIRVGHLKHHTARSDTPCREKLWSGSLAWEELFVFC